MIARSAFGDSSTAVVRAEEAAEQRSDGDQSRSGPADPVERHHGVRQRRNDVHHQRQQVLRGVHPLHRLGQQRTHHADQQDALRRGEVAAVDPDRERADDQATIRPVDTTCASSGGPAPVGPGLDPRPEHHQQQRTDQQHRHHRDEHLLGQVQQQPRTEARAEQRRRDLPPQAVPLAAQLAPVAPGARDAAGHQADRVRHRRGHRRIAQRHQRGERDQRAGSDDGVDRSGPDAREGDQDHVGRRAPTDPSDVSRSAIGARRQRASSPLSAGRRPSRPSLGPRPRPRARRARTRAPSTASTPGTRTSPRRRRSSRRSASTTAR